MTTDKTIVGVLNSVEKFCGGRKIDVFKKFLLPCFLIHKAFYTKKRRVLNLKLLIAFRLLILYV
ncbi:hypothetical protein CEP67_11400 [Staphylococcus pettenkoferi]|nr:hypothetical protein CEP67_11400 [Staphylococcus pettenkoferi]